MGIKLKREILKKQERLCENLKIHTYIEISRPKALMSGTQFKITINRKYKFAKRWNCSKRFFGKNVQSMLKLGRAQGVAMSAALYRNIPIFEYAPKKIKMSITGNGNASKEQVAAMLKSILNIAETPHHLDASDGLAAGVCHFFQRNPTKGGSNYSGWGAFIKDNPEKLK